MEQDAIILQTLVELRDQLAGDYTGDFEDMKELTDKVIIQILRRIDSTNK